MKFSTTAVADSMGWESRVVRSELRGLQFNDRQTSGRAGISSTVLVEFCDTSFHLSAPGDLSSEELDYICDFLHKKVKKHEEKEVEKLHLLHAVLKSCASQCHHETAGEQDVTLSQTKLKALIQQYFNEGLDCETVSQLGIPVLEVANEISLELANQISRDIHSLVSIHSDHSFNGRAVARIFHGISSPCYPAEVWGRQPRFWRSYLDVDFNLLCRVATVKLLELR